MALPGFWFFVATVLLEKAIVHMLTSFAVACISERLANADQSYMNRGNHVTLLFSPATRYVFFSENFYSGLPRNFWQRNLITLGWVERVEDYA